MLYLGSLFDVAAVIIQDFSACYVHSLLLHDRYRSWYNPQRLIYADNQLLCGRGRLMGNAAIARID